MRQKSIDQLYFVIKKSLFLVVGIILLVIFLNTIKAVLLFFLAAFIFTLMLNPVVDFLEQRGIGRVAGSLLTISIVFLVFGVFAWLIVPQLLNEGSKFLQQLPSYISHLSDRVETILRPLPNQQLKTLVNHSIQSQLFPTIQSILLQLSSYVFSVVDLLLYLILFVSIVAYSLIDPRPLFETYLYLFPKQSRSKAADAFIEGANMVGGWIRSVAIVGVIEAVAATIFLVWIGLPGAILWGTFAFFAELIPRISAYVMLIPPFLIALAIDPVKALWVLVFYLVLNEATADFIFPKLQESTMKINPVYGIFILLAMGYAFGFLGILIATPISGFVKAFWEEFYVKNQMTDKTFETYVSRMLNQKKM